jgi:hypothetical protein
MMLVTVGHYIWLTLGKTTWISGSFDFVTTSKIQTFLITRLILNVYVNYKQQKTGHWVHARLKNFKAACITVCQGRG